MVYSTDELFGVCSATIHVATILNNRLDTVVSEDDDLDKAGIKRSWPIT